jgi:hypothetical protein
MDKYFIEIDSYGNFEKKTMPLNKYIKIYKLDFLGIKKIRFKITKEEFLKDNQELKEKYIKVFNTETDYFNYLHKEKKMLVSDIVSLPKYNLEI